MDRYGKINIGEVTRGMRVRITQRYYQGGHHTMLVQEGTVESTVQRERPGLSLIPNVPAKPIIETVSIQLFGWNVELKMGQAWDLISIEEALPPLPTTPGSAVLCENGLLAVLRVDPRVDSDDLEWVWANSFDSAGPGESQLASAKIVHTAPR